uniref:Uncharacterized protein n=1 Tax=Akkesiphycus lubricus TaxID=3022 RepID=A0A8F0FBL2_AKKLU|nr:hypothetical protein [Akkesiphycus lubricus]
MGKAKKHSENDLSKYYDSCPIFKKYCQFDLWSEDFCEYDNIKYCEFYISLYTYAFTRRFLLNNFSPSCLAVLYTSPFLIKFIRSGFFKYIDFNFLSLFHDNCFFYPRGSGRDIEIFVEEYFKKYIKIKFEEDILACLIKSLYLFVPKSLKDSTMGRFNIFYGNLFTDSRGFYSVMTVEYLKSSLFCFVSPSSMLFDSFTVGTVYKSVKRYKVPLKDGLFNLSNLFLENTYYGWGSFFIIRSEDTSYPDQFFIDLVFYDALKNHKYFTEVSLLPLGYELCFCTFLKIHYKPSTFILNKPTFIRKSGIQVLIQSIEALEVFDYQINDIGLYREVRKIFPGSLEVIGVKPSCKNVTCTFKGFNGLSQTCVKKSTLTLGKSASKSVVTLKKN